MSNPIRERITIESTTVSLDTQDDGSLRLRIERANGSYLEVVVSIHSKYGPMYSCADAGAFDPSFQAHTAMAIAWAMANHWEFRVAFRGDAFMNFV